MINRPRRYRHDAAILALLAASSFIASAVPARTDPGDLGRICAQLRVRFEELRQKAGFPGATIAFELPDGSAGSLAVGYADVERKVRMRPGDVMFSGSTGKTFVSAVALQLVDEGKLRLDDKLESYLGQETWFSRLPNAHSITIRMLLNHTSGVPNHVNYDNFAADLRREPEKVWQPAELIAYVLDKPPLFVPGQGWSYADTNYILAGMVIEGITHDTYYHQLETRILKPLHFVLTQPSDRPTLPGVVPGYPDPTLPFGTGSKVMPDRKYPFNPQVEWTGGGVVTTSAELARWAKLLYEGKVFSAESLHELLDGVDTSTPGVRYGLGADIVDRDGEVFYGHTGEMPGYNTAMVYWPKHKISVAIQFNSDNPKVVNERLEKYAMEALRVILRKSTIAGSKQ